MNVLVHTQITLHAENKPARDVLRAVLAQTSQKLTWSLLYDIDDKTYYLNVIPVVKDTSGPLGKSDSRSIIDDGKTWDGENWRTDGTFTDPEGRRGFFPSDLAALPSCS